MLFEAWAAMPTEAKIARAKHVGLFDRLNATLASRNAYCCEAGLAFELKECGQGRHAKVPKGWDQIIA